jgi:hypothetical protein
MYTKASELLSYSHCGPVDKQERADIRRYCRPVDNRERLLSDTLQTSGLVDLWLLGDRDQERRKRETCT